MITTCRLRDDSAYQMFDNPYRVARGGSWHDNPQLCRSAARIRFMEKDAEEYIGFRVVCDAMSINHGIAYFER